MEGREKSSSFVKNFPLVPLNSLKIMLDLFQVLSRVFLREVSYSKTLFEYIFIQIYVPSYQRIFPTLVSLYFLTGKDPSFR